MSKIESFKDLIVYQKAYKLAMEIFEISKSYPKEEKFLSGYNEVHKMLVSMINHPEKWCL